jgi:hypothetical protein
MILNQRLQLGNARMQEADRIAELRSPQAQTRLAISGLLFETAYLLQTLRLKKSVSRASFFLDFLLFPEMKTSARKT